MADHRRYQQAFDALNDLASRWVLHPDYRSDIDGDAAVALGRAQAAVGEAYRRRRQLEEDTNA